MSLPLPSLLVPLCRANQAKFWSIPPLPMTMRMNYTYHLACFYSSAIGILYIRSSSSTPGSGCSHRAWRYWMLHPRPSCLGMPLLSVFINGDLLAPTFCAAECLIPPAHLSPNNQWWIMEADMREKWNQQSMFFSWRTRQACFALQAKHVSVNFRELNKMLSWAFTRNKLAKIVQMKRIQHTLDTLKEILSCSIPLSNYSLHLWSKPHTCILQITHYFTPLREQKRDSGSFLRYRHCSRWMKPIILCFLPIISW